MWCEAFTGAGTSSANRAVTRRSYNGRMPGTEPSARTSAGVPAAPDLDVNALVERLREELAGGRNGAGDGRGTLLAARHRAERLWAVSADRPLERRPGLKGWVAYPLKRILRPFLRWYVEPLAAEQRSFNDVVLKIIDGTLEEVDRGDAARARAEQTLVELGTEPGTALEQVQRFREHDEATLREQAAVKDDEGKLIASARAAARQLESLFEADVR